jgi:hypothetical protein
MDNRRRNQADPAPRPLRLETKEGIPDTDDEREATRCEQRSSSWVVQALPLYTVCDRQVGLEDHGWQCAGDADLAVPEVP